MRPPSWFIFGFIIAGLIITMAAAGLKRK